jgi:hypothetical protein
MLKLDMGAKENWVILTGQRSGLAWAPTRKKGRKGNSDSISSGSASASESVGNVHFAILRPHFETGSLDKFCKG